MLQGKSSSFYYVGFGVSQYLLDRKLMISVSANDPFWREKTYNFEFNDPTFSSHSVNRYLTRTFRLSLTYNFGKMDLQVKKARRGINNDDLKGGGGGGQGGETQQ